MSVSLEEAKERFKDAGFSRADRYERGTEGKGSAWANAKSRAKENYGPAMQEVISKNLYDSGLDRADAGDYDRGIRDKGLANWGTGMQAGAEKWGDRSQPFVDLWDRDLPTPQGPKRSGANRKRMNENVERFIKAAGK